MTNPLSSWLIRRVWGRVACGAVGARSRHAGMPLQRRGVLSAYDPEPGAALRAIEMLALSADSKMLYISAERLVDCTALEGCLAAARGLGALGRAARIRVSACGAIADPGTRVCDTFGGCAWGANSPGGTMVSSPELEPWGCAGMSTKPRRGDRRAGGVESRLPPLRG